MIFLKMTVYNNEVKEGCAEIVCPYCDCKHFVIPEHHDNRCMRCKTPLSVPQFCVSAKVIGRLRYHKMGWITNDIKMLEKFNNTYSE